MGVGGGSALGSFRGEKGFESPYTSVILLTHNGSPRNCGREITEASLSKGQVPEKKKRIHSWQIHFSSSLPAHVTIPLCLSAALSTLASGLQLAGGMGMMPHMAVLPKWLLLAQLCFPCWKQLCTPVK